MQVLDNLRLAYREYKYAKGKEKEKARQVYEEKKSFFFAYIMKYYAENIKK